MTAEVAVLNKTAIAVATDSAVVLEGASGTKLFESVNKLFALSYSQPLGVMLFNNPEIAGIPWETLIKEYRTASREHVPQSLDECAKHLISFIERQPSLQHRGGDIAREAMEDFLIRLRGQVAAQVQKRLADVPELPDSDISEILNAVAEENLHNLEAAKAWGSLQDLDEGSLAPVEQYAEELIHEVFDHHTVFTHTFVVLKRILSLALIRQFDTATMTGLVLMGFPGPAVFPSLLVIHVDGLVEGRLRWTIDDTEDITTEDTALIAPFAQRDVVDSFLTGLNPDVSVFIREYWESLETDVPSVIGELVRNHIPNATSRQVDSIVRDLKDIAVGGLETYDNALLHEQHVHQVTPVLRAVEALPKAELAEMAETLVSLTIFRRRMTITDETATVGGSIDVAVISKSDGFVWIKRKHYFGSECNPGWATRHYLQ